MVMFTSKQILIIGRNAHKSQPVTEALFASSNHFTKQMICMIDICDIGTVYVHTLCHNNEFRMRFYFSKRVRRPKGLPSSHEIVSATFWSLDAISSVVRKTEITLNLPNKIYKT